MKMNRVDVLTLVINAFEQKNLEIADIPEVRDTLEAMRESIQKRNERTPEQREAANAKARAKRASQKRSRYDKIFPLIVNVLKLTDNPLDAITIWQNIDDENRHELNIRPTVVSNVIRECGYGIIQIDDETSDRLLYTLIK